MADEIKTIEAEDGIEIAYREFLPEGAEEYPCLLFIHGSTCHGGAYGNVGPDLAEAGIGATLMDVRGHGLSGGPRGDVPVPVLLLKDIERLLGTIRGPHCAKLFLGGHSSGGGIAAKYYAEYQKNIDGLVLLAPHFHHKAPQNRRDDTGAVEVSKTKLALSLLNPSIRFLHYNIADEEDELSVADYSLNWTRATQLADYEAGLRAIDLPVVWIVGEEDDFFDVEIMRREFEKMPSQDKQFILREGIEHTMVTEESVPQMAEWIKGHCS
ncbi:MAG: alpha/beta hydrolase [Planctomycetes bacterium]|nr:alpha/beta hydrolase [Planctomycetota bacterium]